MNRTFSLSCCRRRTGRRRPKGHPLSNRGSVSLKELEPYPIIAFDKSSGLNEMINKLLEQAQVHLKTACHVEEDNAMAGFVAAGYGVAIYLILYTWPL